ncbi:hypothetical protein ACTPEF_26505, partial [Clostridioides difficile]
FFKLLKLAFGSILLMVAFNLNMVLGIGVFLVGVVYILYKRNMGKSEAKKIIGVEIQEDVYEMATRSIKLNGLEERVEIINEDIK